MRAQPTAVTAAANANSTTTRRGAALRHEQAQIDLIVTTQHEPCIRRYLASLNTTNTIDATFGGGSGGRSGGLMHDGFHTLLHSLLESATALTKDLFTQNGVPDRVRVQVPPQLCGSGPSSDPSVEAEVEVEVEVDAAAGADGGAGYIELRADMDQYRRSDMLCVASSLLLPVMDTLELYGADVNAWGYRNLSAETPLHTATRLGAAPLVHWLLQHGT